MLVSRYVFSLAAIQCACLAVVVSAQTPIAFNTVALSGSQGTSSGFGPQLGSGIDFTVVDGGVINNSGDVAFTGTLSGIGINYYLNDFGIWSNVAGQLHLVARTGLDGPGPNQGPGSAFVYNGMNPFLTESGTVAFFSQFNGPNGSGTGIWSNAGGSIAPLAIANGVGPGPNLGPQLVFQIIGKYGYDPGSSFSPLWFDESGNFAFVGQVNTGTYPYRNGIWTNAGGPLAPVALERAAGPGPNLGPDGPGPNLGPGTFFALSSPPAASINASGEIAFTYYVGGIVGASQASQGIWTNVGGVLHAIALNGTDSALGPNQGPGVSFGGFTAPEINNAGTVAFRSSLAGGADDGKSGIWTATGGKLTLIASSAIAGPGPNLGTGITFGPFSGLVHADSLDDAGNLTFVNTITGNGVDATNNEGIWRTIGGTLTAIARTGSAGPGPNIGPGIYFRDFRGGLYGANSLLVPAANNAGQVVFFAHLLGSNVTLNSNFGIFEWADGRINQIVRTGQLFDVDPSPTRQDLRTIARTDNQFDNPGIIMPLGVALGTNGAGPWLNDKGEIVLSLHFTDGSYGIFTAQLPPRVLPGDFNLDGHLGADDVNAMLGALTNLKDYQTQHQLTDLELLRIGDLDGNQTITNADIPALVKLVASVPEPNASGLGLFGFGLLAMFHRRQRIKAFSRGALA